jgi:hypothetical protein
MQKRFIRSGSIAAIVVIGALTALAVFEPALAALACPLCYGFERIEPNVFIDREAASESRTEARDIVQEAEAKDLAFYGQLKAAPSMFLCTTQACYSRVGGGSSRGMAILDIALFLSPRGMTPVIAAHELSHVELHSRLGWRKTLSRDIPQWFDEGVAVIVSDDPRYRASETADECAKAATGDLPALREAWINDGRHDRLYSAAAQRIGCWMSTHGGPKAVVGLVDKVAHGMLFDAVYR